MSLPDRIGYVTSHDSPTATTVVTAVTTPTTIIFAASAGRRLGTAESVERIMPVEYSPVTVSAPSTATASCANV